MADVQKLACNREPFATDSSCDRGDVDIGLFDQFPLCEVISPTEPDAAPPTFDFPIVPFTPPPCACVAVDAHGRGHVEDRKNVLVDVDFKSAGDCCEGNYTADIDVRVPCVPFKIEDGGQRGINIKNVGCDSPSGSIALNVKTEECTLSIDPKIDLNLPCMPFSIRGGDTVRNISIEELDCSEPASGSFNLGVRQQCGACTISLNPEIRLALPKPPSYDFEEGEVEIEQRCDGSSGWISLEKQGNDCDATIVPKLSLAIDCAPFAINSENGNVDVNMVCSGDPGQEDVEGTGTLSLSITKGCCEFTITPNLSLTIPKSPIYEFLDGEVDLNYSCDAGRNTFTIEETGDGCRKTIRSRLDLDLDCMPFDIVSKAGRVTVNTYCSGGSPSGTLELVATKNCCALELQPILNLTVPAAPSFSFNSGDVNVAYGCGASGGNIGLNASGGNCSYSVTPSLSLNLDCMPFNVVTTPGGSSISLSDGDGSVSFTLGAQKKCCSLQFSPSMNISVPCALSNLSISPKDEEVFSVSKSGGGCSATYEIGPKGLSGTLHFLQRIWFDGTTFQFETMRLTFKDGILVRSSGISEPSVDIATATHKNKCCDDDGNGGDGGDAAKDAARPAATTQGWPWLY